MNDHDERLSYQTPLAKTADGVMRIRGMGVEGERERMGQAGRRRVEHVLELGDFTRKVVKTLERAIR